MSSSVSRAVRFGLLGSIPGVTLLLINAWFVDGEAELTVGVIAILTLVAGVVAGVISGLQPELRFSKATAGALIGALPGVLYGRAISAGFAVLIIVAGAVVGWYIGQRFEHRAPGSRAR